MIDLLMSILETMFRFFPFPTRTGLRMLGQPGPDSPVLVTCNFDLTVRRVIKALRGVDCYLLVAPSKGINVWCAAGGGLFSAHSVSSVIKTSRIGEKVSHRTVILPQLAAPGIDVVRVERDTGWHCTFGPVYAKDIPAYLTAGRKKTEEMRRAAFPLAQRLEMAVMWAVPLSLLAAIPTAIVSWRSTFGILVLVWAFSLFLFVFFDVVMRYVPGPVGLVKTLVLGAVGALGVVAYGVTIGNWRVGHMVGWSMAILVVAAVLGFDLDGTSPLVAGSSVAYWGRKWPVVHQMWHKMGFVLEEWFTLEVNRGQCTGCGTCVEVCPKSVFGLQQRNSRLVSVVEDMEACERCTACVRQCPEAAIVAEPVVERFA
jgi:NAD-dependent dihydropyrimidine dehydrogenase PreA subunit